jgi:Papain family cysteine protease
VRAIASARLLVLTLAACRGGSIAADDAGPAALAAKDVSPPKKPPALRVAHAKVPSLPDLPALLSHEAPAQAPTDSELVGNPCHAVWTGSETTPLACARSLLFGAVEAAKSGGGASLLVPRALLARDPAVLPPVSDHRLEGTEGPTRNQGQVPACTAFATATALDHALIRWSGQQVTASTMQIWARYHSPSVETSLLSNVGQPIGPEQVWPFDAREAITWVPCADVPKSAKAKCGAPVDDPRIGKLVTSSLGEFTEVEYLPMPFDATVARTKIAAGQDIIVGMELPAAFVPKGRAGARYIPHYTKSAGPDAGHALVLAGYAQLAHGVYFLAHNSWGTGWGDAGYAWIHEATLSAWVREAVAVDAEPLDRDATSRPRKDRWAKACPPGLLPDSIRAVCSPPCADGSPRHDDVCAIAGQCPPSYVNLSGSCVLAAPAAKGSDPSTGISWQCGPGGCAYRLPRASDPECTGSVCDAACPAPDFHVAKMGETLVCVE